MDWATVGKALAPILANSAPTIGSILGGALLPGIGGGLGEMAGKIIADQFGVPPTPDDVHRAIVNSPTDIAMQKLQAAEAEAVAKWPALAEIAKANAESDTSQAQAINETMRAELTRGQPWHAWRNLYGYSVTVEVAMIFPLFMVSIAFFPEIFTRFMQASTWLTGWYTLRFGLLGFIHSGASNEKIAAVTGEAPSIVKGIAAAVKKK